MFYVEWIGNCDIGFIISCVVGMGYGDECFFVFVFVE